MIGSKQLKVGMIIQLNGELWRIMATAHTQPGKGGAYIQTKMRNLIKGTQTDHRFRSGEPVQRVVLDQVKSQFLYQDGDDFHFMDAQTFNQFQLKKDQLEDAIPYLIPNFELMVEVFEENPIGIVLPKSVKVKIIETEPYIKTATATNSFKQATMETGHPIQVPGFIEVGEVVEIDTESGKYIGRA